ncbi:MAG: Crp/Fnr family transcriptional regulator [Treponema sp.]|nr:MAG: Crp/Fnr family transcriptional regulator [Treponema sp.]
MPKLVNFSKGSIVYFEDDKDDKIYILQSGTIILTSIDPETKITVTNQVKPGEFFGVKSALGRFPREETATVLQDSQVIALTVPEFEKNFSGNKQIIMKMLRVFSAQLRQIHKRIEQILNSTPESPQAGMLAVAKSFFEDEEFVSCYDVCLKYLKRFPQSPYIEHVKKLFAASQMYLERRGMPKYEAPEDGGLGALKQFELSAFERFAKKYAPGQVVISEFEPGDTFYLIQRGSVQLMKYVNGTEKNLDILKPGEFFGEMAILDNSPRSATCMAKTSVKCLEFSKENFESIVTGNAVLALNLLKLFCKRIYDQRRRFKILAIKDLQARIADVFILLDEMNPPNNPNERSRKFYVNTGDIAHWAGLSFEITREEINRLVEKRKIEVYNDSIVVANITDMQRIVDTRSSMGERALNSNTK